jgi:hypothetical protein
MILTFNFEKTKWILNLVEPRLKSDNISVKLKIEFQHEARYEVQRIKLKKN